jgi:hypothetical protein
MQLLRNAFRHKLRTALTILSVTIAILAFGLLRTFIGAWYSGVKASSANRIVTRNAISLIFPLPLAYKDRIRQVEGVTLVSYGNWFGGIYLDRKKFPSNFPSWIQESEPLSGSRLAWCYGDLGISTALWQAAQSAGNKDWEKMIERSNPRVIRFPLFRTVEMRPEELSACRLELVQVLIEQDLELGNV